MIVYQYDPETGIHSGNMTAQESPREPCVYLIPANCTSQKTPEIGEHECAVFENEKWLIKPNWRGVTYWLPDGTEHTIDAIDVVPPENALFEKPIIPQTLEEAKTAKLTEINAACDAILNAAVKTYPNSEVLTFDQQTAEAKAYLASGNAADAPLLSALASGRGIEFDDLVNRVMAKHHAFSVLSGIVIGQRQALEDRLRVCETIEDVKAIEVNFALSEAKDEQTA